MVKIDAWALPTNTQGEPKIEISNVSDINVDNDDVENILENVGYNNWTNNNGIWVDNKDLSNNSLRSEVLDIGTLGGLSAGSNPIKKVFLTGKMNLTNPTDNINLYFSNGVHYYMGTGIRPHLNGIDGMYHFTFCIGDMENGGFDRYVKVGNVCGTDITNLTINYTFLK